MGEWYAMRMIFEGADTRQAIQNSIDRLIIIL